MYLVLLRFTENRDRAVAALEGHKAWLARGFAEGVFLLAGGLPPKTGGFVLVQGEDRTALEDRVAGDPFVTEGVVSVEVIEIAPAKADARLSFLLAEGG